MPKTPGSERPPTPAARVIALPLRGLIWFYRVAVSPWTGANCRFQPTCSDYAEQALRRYGAARGGWLALKRILRCHPWGAHGYDPLPAARSPDDDEREP